MRDRDRLYRLRNLALTLTGVPRWHRDALLDDRRHAIVVTHHAIVQAGDRYRMGDPVRIIADVADAILNGRIGKRYVGERSWWAAKAGSTCAWTADEDRAYVVRHSRRTWVVVTALPTDRPPQPTAKYPAPYRRPKAATATRLPVLLPAAHDLHRHGIPAVGAALQAAGIRRNG